MAKNFVQKGHTCTFIAPANLKSGDPFMVGSAFAVAAYDALLGAPVEGHVVGVFTLPKPNSVVAFSAGERVFFDAATGLCKKTATGFFAIGFATVAAAATDASVMVRLDGQSLVAA
jgi:predicted RecA/RadA family phage recombinase